MAFDFSTLVTDRTQQDVAYVKQLIDKLITGTATDAEKAEWNSFTLKGAYNHTDLNRVTAALDALWQRLLSAGYTLPRYKRIQIDHVVPEPPATSRLPDGYTELEYIQSSGTQYLDTGFIPNQNTRLVLDGYNDLSSSGWTYGTWESATSKQFAGSCNKSYAVRYGSTNATLAENIPVGPVHFDQNKNAYNVNGATGSFSAQTFSCQYSIFLFAINAAGAVSSGKFTGKIYSCQIYDNGTLVRAYVPCINPSGAVGLYDFVGKRFYGNAGTGTFGAGDVVDYSLPDGYEELAYIQSSGTQYVDTLFKPNNNTRVVMDVELPVQGSYPKGLFGVRDATSGNKNSFLMWVYDQSFNTGFATVGKAISLTTSGRFTVDKNKTANIINGTTYSADTDSTFQSSYSLLLLALMNSNGVDSRMVSGKLYSCQIYDNGTLVRAYVPCINPSGAYGLYDLVNAQFYGNAGSGSFTGGEAVAEPAVADLTVATEEEPTEYDPYLWYDIDVPTTSHMTQYLANVDEVRTAFAMLATTPITPESMELLTWVKANHIEQILVDVEALLTAMTRIYIRSGLSLAYSSGANFYFIN